MLEHRKMRLNFLMIIQICFCVDVAGAVSREEEVKLGKEEHAKIISRFGVYRDQELQAYINKVGQRVAAESNREEINY